MSEVTAEFHQKLKSKDPELLAELVNLHTKDLFNACRGLGFDQIASEDLTQNVWITFFEVLENFEARSSVRTFLFGILYKKASEMRRQIKRADPTDEIEDFLDQHFDSTGHWINPPIDPESFLNSAQVMGLIANCLELLPVSQQMAFTLREVHDESTEHICQALEVSSSNLGVLLFRAKTSLRNCIETKNKRMRS